MPATVAIVRCPSYEPAVVDRALDEAFQLLGGLGRYIKRDEQVLLKPSLPAAAAPDEHATTHPEVVAGVIRQVQQAGGRCFIAESPTFGSLARVAETAGVGAVARRYEAPLVELNRPTHLPVKNPLTGRWLVGDPCVTRADVIINLPKLQAGTPTRVTGAVENLYGCVPGRRKAWWQVQARRRPEVFCDMLVENARAVSSALTVVDAVMVKDRQGPRPMGVLVIGTEPVAVDAVLCDLMGVPAPQDEILQAATRRGIGTPELAAIQVVGERLDQVRLRV
ncbi:MAG: DUF362 domain-containing protein [Candidatus Omnitrophica bacterium]|nr:DUF362 domain-containing protein [Candidatus Omnitrophota bacterium]